MKTVYVKMEISLTMKVNQDVDVSEVLDEIDYVFSDTTGKAKVTDAQIMDRCISGWEDTNSK